MKFVNDLAVGDTINDFYLVKSKEVRAKKNGDPYLALVLADKTGDIRTMMWDNVDAVRELFEQGDLVKVQGRINAYNDQIQATIGRLRPVTDKDFHEGLERSNYFAAAERDTEDMWQELMSIVEMIEPEPLRQLVVKIFERFEKEFKHYPAARTVHHSYICGLLEHTLSVAETCVYLAEKYAPLDTGLLLSAAVLHDIGKILELPETAGKSYTPHGMLLGHMIMGCEIVHETAKEVEGLDEEQLLLLEHCILSHQGIPEWGSPKRPKIIEALLCHYADDMDAKANIFRRVLKNDKNDGHATARDPYIERHLFKRSNTGYSENA
ncbi:3'-5' exoribonuclease YhaM family protein [Candidatus Hydrogenedentota bacterium]